ncbi:phosphoglucan phosphatase DSP4, chloroplastic isoform X3 [Selaginella moellendorffii]|uniref:phosphoglucan phosphatase DSP4, chloroplastic isoform X3 n=1 Tax=Selaginella moellendorffii TaxID=88036 RepID=UPI000D1CFDF7|nr:phosphoglucan phosphatase DSP4, chloroplastic isoform X3 [Selaginella moellendorffii]|eukprot:XP_002973850.2 phosphoglucan phosphatase DSP4, chloroplastic isoform X3 [Selaginella moellendorffii]
MPLVGICSAKYWHFTQALQIQTLCLKANVALGLEILFVTWHLVFVVENHAMAAEALCPRLAFLQIQRRALSDQRRLDRSRIRLTRRGGRMWTLCKRASISAQRFVVSASHSSEEEGKEETSKKADDYSAVFQKITQSDLTYRHELGMNYNRVLPNLIVGSCLQNPADVDRLKKDENVTTVCNLQQDPDMAYFNVDISEIRDHAKEVGDFNHLRLPIRDMDGFALRMRLPSVIASLYQELKDREGTLYVHCTAGLGRAPAVALGYMFWVLGYDLHEAYLLLQSKRKCVPSMENIRAATCDLLTGMTRSPIGLLYRRGTCEHVEVAGLDIGWHSRLPFNFISRDGHWTLEHELPVGRYEYKYVIDKERWTYNPHAPITNPDRKGNYNNYIEVVDSDPENWELRQYWRKEDAKLTDEQRSVILEKLEAMGSEL